MIQTAPFPCPRHPPLSFDSSSQQHNCRRDISHSLLFERIRGFRFSMAAGSQSVESGRKSWTASSWEKNPFFLGNRTLFNSRASPRCWRRFAYVLKLFTRDTFSTCETIGSLRKWAGWEGEGGCQRVPRAIRLFSLLECSPLLAPSRAATPLCPENGRYHSTSITY